MSIKAGMIRYLVMEECAAWVRLKGRQPTDQEIEIVTQKITALVEEVERSKNTNLASLWKQGKCPRCAGSGKIKVAVVGGSFTPQHAKKCETCGGTGKLS